VTFDSDRSKIRLAVNLFLLAHKTGKLNLLLGLLIACWKAKMSWDEATGRLDGSFYDEQVHQATDKYLSNQPKCDTSGVPGFNRWKREQGL
jgi:hypothetical protein